VVWELRCEASRRHTWLLISGCVLLVSQKREIERVTQTYLKGKVDYRCEIKALADYRLNLEIGWARPKSGILDIYSVPRDFSLQGTLASQVRSLDPPFRVLLARAGWLLVQLHDLTLGWAKAEHIEYVNAKEDGWRALRRRASPGVGWSAEESISSVIERASDYLGVPYLLGGTTTAGIDCSGLMQRAYEGACGTILPKHSSDQSKLGRPVSLDRQRAGDMIFFARAGQPQLHVGLLCDKDRVIHASSRSGCVRQERLSELLTMFDTIKIRRLIEVSDS
jgi:hypothetical protein